MKTLYSLSLLCAEGKGEKYDGIFEQRDIVGKRHMTERVNQSCMAHSDGLSKDDSH